MLKKSFVVCLMILVLAGCGGPDADSPEGVVEQFFARLEDRNEAEVKNLLCEDFRQNVHFGLGDQQEARLKTDLKMSAEDAGDEAETVSVNVYGRIETVWQTEHVRLENKMRRDEESPWTIQLFKVDDVWRVCGGDPFILQLLNVEAAVSALEE